VIVTMRRQLDQFMATDHQAHITQPFSLINRVIVREFQNHAPFMEPSVLKLEITNLARRPEGAHGVERGETFGEISEEFRDDLTAPPLRAQDARNGAQLIGGGSWMK